MNWQLFRLGWRRRSAPILDASGCPSWLWKLRCPRPKGWGSMLYQMTDMLDTNQDENMPTATRDTPQSAP